jgi:glyoxylase-like metal-dependent hydrolase (beta-lactamase superfamily II)
VQSSIFSQIQADIHPDPTDEGALVIRIKLASSNAYIVKGKRCLLVDTGSPGESTKIVEELRRNGIDVKELALILHTHGHSDHCGSTAELRRLTRTPTALHVADIHMMERGRNDPLIPTRPAGWLIRPFVDNSFEPVSPDLLLEGEPDLAEYGVAGRIVYTPGHTSGSVSLVTSEGQAIVGDLMMGGYMGGQFFPLLPDYHYFADDLGMVRTSIKKILDLSPKEILVGHGGSLHPEAVRERFRRDIES